MNTSVSSTPIGSVATSAVPIRDQIRSTSSGNAARTAFSMLVFRRIDSSRSVPASRTTFMLIAPSDRRGTNSEPSRGAIVPKATASTPAAMATTTNLWCMHSRKIGVWKAWARRMSSGTRSSPPRPSQTPKSSRAAAPNRSHNSGERQAAAGTSVPSSAAAVPPDRSRPATHISTSARADRGRPARSNSTKLARTGMSVRDSTIEPARAKMTVRAIGRNLLPSTPSRVRMGR